MTLVSGFLTYIVVWWLVFFMALPFGAEPEVSPLPGHAESAPARPRLWLKAGAATVLAGLITWGFAALIDSGLIDFRPAPPA